MQKKEVEVCDAHASVLNRQKVPRSYLPTSKNKQQKEAATTGSLIPYFDCGIEHCRQCKLKTGDIKLFGNWS